MNVYDDSESLKKQLINDIEYIKKMLRDSYDNLDTILKSKLEVGEVVLLKDSLNTGIIKGFSIGQTMYSSKIIHGEQARYIQVHVICLKGDITTRLENLVVYSDAARLLYTKKIPIIRDEIPF